jgi:hypothetical protein
MLPRVGHEPLALALTRRGVLALAAIIWSCNGRVGTQSAGSQPDGTDSGSDLAIGGDGRDGGADTLNVAIRSTAAAVCRGQCVDLTASAGGGVSPYSYSWSGGLAAGAGPEHVCPSQSSTYTVVATDSSGTNGELAKAPAHGSASISVDVSSSCSSDAGPAGALDAIAPDAAPPVPSTGLSVRCSVSWPAGDASTNYPNPRGANTPVAVDSAGNMVVAATFTQSITVGARSIASLGSNDLIVIKLDPQCNVLWTKQFGADGAAVDPLAVAFDPSGNAIVGGSFQTNSGLPVLGEVDFGTGGRSAVSQSGFVFELTATGNTAWANVYAGDGSGSDFVAVEDVATRPNGDVVLAVLSDTPVDFGAGLAAPPDAGVAGGRDWYLVDLGPTGTLAFAKDSESFEPSTWIIESVDTTSDGSIWLGGTGMADTFANGVGGSSEIHAVHVDGQGVLLARRTVMSPTTLPWNGAVVRVGPAGDAVLSASWAADNSGISWTRWLEGLSPQASVTWTYASLADYGSSFDPSEVARVDAYGRTWLSGEFAGSLALGAPAGTLGSTSAGGVDVVALGTSGQLLSGSAPAALGGSVVGDMALAPGGPVVVAGWSEPGSAAALFVSRLGF